MSSFNMDLGKRDKPKKHWQHPRRTFSMDIIDGTAAIDFPRLIRDRKKRLQEHMKKYGFGALILYDPGTIRYVTGTIGSPTFHGQTFLRYALLPENADPILFEMVGLREAYSDLGFQPSATVKPAIVWKDTQTGVVEDPGCSYYAKRWATDLKETLKQHGLEKEKVGLDKLDFPMVKALTEEGINYADGNRPILEARAIKFKDELELLKISAAIADGALAVGREALRPGAYGRDVAAKMLYFLRKAGCQVVHHNSCFAVYKGSMGRMLRHGDMVHMENVFYGAGGYRSDFCRTYFCGDVEPTEEQKEIWRTGHDAMYEAINAVRPGATTRDVAEKMLPGLEDKYETMGLGILGHGIGISQYDLPIISRAYSLKYPMEIKPGMFFAIENFARSSTGGPDRVRCEENLIVTDTGYEIVSLAPEDPRLRGPE